MQATHRPGSRTGGTIKGVGDRLAKPVRLPLAITWGTLPEWTGKREELAEWAYLSLSWGVGLGLNSTGAPELRP